MLVPPSVRVAAAVHEHAAPAVERVARARPGSTRPAEFARERRRRAALAASTCSRGPACSVRGFQRSSSCGDRVGGQRRRAQVARRCVAPSAASSADRVQREGRARAPSRRRGAGARNTPTGRSTRADRRRAARRRAPASVGEAIRQQRRSSASKASGCASAQRESCVAACRVERRAGARARAAGRPARPRPPGRRGRSAAARARARSASSSARGGRRDARPVEAGLAVGLAPARRSARGRRAARAASALTPVMPWRRRTACGVGVGVEPGVGVVGVDGAVGGQPLQRPRAQPLRPARRARRSSGRIGGRRRSRACRLRLGRGRRRPRGARGPGRGGAVAVSAGGSPRLTGAERSVSMSLLLS